MDKNNWWHDFFKGDFSDVVLTQDAQPAFDFITNILNIQPGYRIYDQCCGKGALSHKLAETGCDIIGVDSSEEYIKKAEETQKSENIKFIVEDARIFRDQKKFDIVINWHTSLGYETEDSQNIKMIEAIEQNLKNGGHFVISTMNPAYVKKHFQRFIVKEVPFEKSTIITIRESKIEGKLLTSDWTIIYPDGRRLHSYGQTKLYSLKDFEKMLSQCGLKILNVYGDIDKRPLSNNCQSIIIHGVK